MTPSFVGDEKWQTRTYTYTVKIPGLATMDIISEVIEQLTGCGRVEADFHSRRLVIDQVVEVGGADRVTMPTLEFAAGYALAEAQTEVATILESYCWEVPDTPWTPVSEEVRS